MIRELIKKIDIADVIAFAGCAYLTIVFAIVVYILIRCIILVVA